MPSSVHTHAKLSTLNSRSYGNTLTCKARNGIIMTRLFSLSLLSIAITACSHSHNKSIDLAAATPMNTMPIFKDECCKRYADFYWLKLAKNDHVKLKLNSASPVWHFPQGQSYFGAFQFADVSGQVVVKIKSLMLNGQVLAPKVMLFNAQFEPQPSKQLVTFTTQYSDALSVNRFEARFPVNAEETPYMVIYGDTSLIGNTVSLPHPAKLRAMKTGTPLPLVSELSYRYSTQGDLDITVDTQSVRQKPWRQPHLKNTQQKTSLSLSQTRKHERHPQEESVRFYHQAIRQAVKANNIAKALALLDEAKSLDIPNSQRVFIDAINQHSLP